MKTGLYILCLLLSICTIKAQSTLSISGKVLDEKHLPLPGATVFLTNTQHITACDEKGSFNLYNIAAGSYQVVVKFLGYQPYIAPITLSSKPITLSVQLNPNTQALKVVTIRPDVNRSKYLEKFKREFLGQTPNARDCKILNPEVLYLDYDKKTKKLTAKADEFLIIENKALGYKLKYLLVNFEFDYNTNIDFYEGYPYFSELPGDEHQQKHWENHRAIAYSGSINHFMRAIYENRVHEEGFNVYKLVGRRMGGVEYAYDEKPVFYPDEIKFDSLLTTVNTSIKKLSFSDCLFVVYDKEPEPELFSELNYSIRRYDPDIISGQTSLVYLLAPHVIIDHNGVHSPANGLFFEGYWAWEKIVDMVPLEYKPNNPKY